MRFLVTPRHQAAPHWHITQVDGWAIPKIRINIPRSQDILNISDGQHEISARDSASRHLNPARRLKGSVGWDGDGWQRVAFWTGSWTTSSTQQRILQQGSSKERELNNCASEMMVFNTSHLARDTCTVGFLLIATTPVGCRVDGWA